MSAASMKDRQVRMFELAKRRGITRKMVQFDACLSESTVRSWADGSHEIPLHALVLLAETNALPLDVLSLLLPDGVELVHAPGVDHATLAASAADYSSDYTKARHPDSEAGVNIGPREASDLNAGAARIRAMGGGTEH